MTREWLILKYGSTANIKQMYDAWLTSMVLHDSGDVEHCDWPFLKEETKLVNDIVNEDD